MKMITFFVFRLKGIYNFQFTLYPPREKKIYLAHLSKKVKHSFPSAPII